jgi:UDP-GlcNAc:undecaprenyl-phosphate GlcNAc-1-phosphate transferase
MHTLLGFVLAMSITMVLIPLLMRWASPLGVIDMPAERKVHAIPVPRVGGIGMVAGILTALLLWGDASRVIRALCACIALLFCFGVWDDRKALQAGPKFAGQALTALIMMSWGGIEVASVTGPERMLLPQYLAAPLTFLFLAGGTNAFNLADGLDGLAGGMAVLCLSGTSLLAFTVGNGAVGGAATVIAGAVIGFLRFNTHPARVFMGDGGSQVLGFAATTLAVWLTQDPQVPLSTALPLLLLGMPLIDTLMVMTERTLLGQSPFKADRRHIHYRLLALGFHHWEAVVILYLLQGGLLVAAWWMRYDEDPAVVAVFIAFAVGVLGPIWLAQRLGWSIRRLPKQWAVDTMVSRRVPATVPNAAANFLLAATLAVFAGWVLICGAPPPRDLRILAVALSGMLVGSLVLRRRRDDVGWTDKLALYSGAALAMFLARQAFPNVGHPPVFECVLFPLLALAVLVCVHTTADRAFRMTPLDVLVLLVVLTVPNLPNSAASARSLGITVAELVLLFYGVEALSFAVGKRWRWVSGAAAAFLLSLAFGF